MNAKLQLSIPENHAAIDALEMYGQFLGGSLEFLRLLPSEYWERILTFTEEYRLNLQVKKLQKDYARFDSRTYEVAHLQYLLQSAEADNVTHQLVLDYNFKAPQLQLLKQAVEFAINLGHYRLRNFSTYFRLPSKNEVCALHQEIDEILSTVQPVQNTEARTYTAPKMQALQRLLVRL